MPRTVTALLTLVILLAYGLAGQNDYADARKYECATKGRGYDQVQDRCVKPLPTKEPR